MKKNCPFKAGEGAGSEGQPGGGTETGPGGCGG